MEQTYITLNDGNKIPQFGLGVFQIPGNEKTKEACLEAFKLGYRHIDTAHAYQNERGVGQAVKESGIPREEIWITSKLWPSEYGEGKTAKAIDKMLERLQTDHIDLLLLHQQFGDYLGAWKDMEKAVAEGKVKSIGLSNFESERLEEVLATATINPSVLQVGAVIGEGTMIDMGAVVGARGTIGKNCHIGAGAVVAGVLEPPSKSPVIIEDGVLVGANAVIIEGVHIGEGAVVAAGAIVLEDVPANAVVAGSPAKIVKMKDEKTSEKTQLLADLRD